MFDFIVDFTVGSLASRPLGSPSRNSGSSSSLCAKLPSSRRARCLPAASARSAGDPCAPRSSASWASWCVPPAPPPQPHAGSAALPFRKANPVAVSEGLCCSEKKAAIAKSRPSHVLLEQQQPSRGPAPRPTGAPCPRQHAVLLQAHPQRLQQGACPLPENSLVERGWWTSTFLSFPRDPAFAKPEQGCPFRASCCCPGPDGAEPSLWVGAAT